MGAKPTAAAITEQWEEDSLSRYAAHASRSRGRKVPEESCSLRTCFQRDRDRIVHCKSFRRLKHKTQVFIAPEGDHYRTRLTHTLEVSGISRTAARALRLNEDLAEAISLGHDLGHTPFGHIGEEALSEIMQKRTGKNFEHNQQSLRVVQLLENEGRGLNLCHEVEDGILRHTGPEQPQTLEGQIVRVADRIAYVNHDVDDALRSGIITHRELPQKEIAALGNTSSSRIDTLVHDLVETSWDRGEISMSPRCRGAMDSLRRFLFQEVYVGSVALRETPRVSGLIEKLFQYYCEHPELLPVWLQGTSDQNAAISDYIAGMTDRYALRTYREFFLPNEWPPEAGHERHSPAYADHLTEPGTERHSPAGCDHHPEPRSRPSNTHRHK